MNEPGFIFITCQIGAEAAVKGELARDWPGLRFAYSRPGFLTFKIVGEHGLDDSTGSKHRRNTTEGVPYRCLAAVIERQMRNRLRVCPSGVVFTGKGGWRDDRRAGQQCLEIGRRTMFRSVACMAARSIFTRPPRRTIGRAGAAGAGSRSGDSPTSAGRGIAGNPDLTAFRP